MKTKGNIPSQLPTSLSPYWLLHNASRMIRLASHKTSINQSKLLLLQLFLIFLSLLPIGEAFTQNESHHGCSHLFANGDQGCSRRNFLDTLVVTAASFQFSSSADASDLSDTTSTSWSSQTFVRKADPSATNLHTSQIIMQAKEDTSDTTALQESVSGFISGSAVSAVKTVVKYPLDTATVRLQMPATDYTLQNIPQLFSGSFDGIAGPLLSNIPAGAIFFAVKDAVKSSIKELGLPKWASTSLAVAAALPPYWFIRNPSEVIKTRLQVGADGYKDMNMIEAFQYTLKEGNVTSLYAGYPENLLYGFPADVIKFIAYDYLSGGRKNLSPANGAIYGAISTGIAQCLTTPLDVARNRIMAEVKNDDSSKDNYIDRLVKIAEEEGIGTLFAGTTPRIGKAMLSGALQFAAYEETKQKITDMFLRR